MKVLLFPPSPKYYFFFLQATYSSIASRNTLVSFINIPFLYLPNISFRLNKVQQ